MTGVSRFIRAMTEESIPVKEQAVGLVWFLTRDDNAAGGTISALCKALEAAGHASQNKTRMRELLEADKRVVKRGEGFAVLARYESVVSNAFERFTTRRAVRGSDSVVPRELFDGTRGYLEKVVAQINGSYDHGMHDCCAVMCRRLGETLIIEVYELQGRANEITDANGNFFMLNKSAHNRRFNARQTDIDAIKTGLRTAAEELLHLAGLAK